MTLNFISKSCLWQIYRAALERSVRKTLLHDYCYATILSEQRLRPSLQCSETEMEPTRGVHTQRWSHSCGAGPWGWGCQCPWTSCSQAPLACPLRGLRTWGCQEQRRGWTPQVEAVTGKGQAPPAPAVTTAAATAPWEGGAGRHISHWGFLVTLTSILAQGWGLLATYGLKNQHYKIAKNMMNSEGKKSRRQ